MMSDKKDTVLLDIIAQFFKIRVHQKCKIILEKSEERKWAYRNRNHFPASLKIERPNYQRNRTVGLMLTRANIDFGNVLTLPLAG